MMCISFKKEEMKQQGCPQIHSGVGRLGLRVWQSFIDKSFCYHYRTNSFIAHFSSKYSVVFFLSNLISSVVINTILWCV